MANNTNTVITVPDWARPYVQLYFNESFNIWQNSGLPAVVIASGMGARAVAQIGGTETVADFGVTNIIVTEPGVFYTTPPPVTIVSVDGQGDGATAVALVAGGQVIAIEVLTRGKGYLSPPNVIIASGGVGAAAVAVCSGGAVTEIDLTAGGNGYITPPTVLILGGHGTGATAHAVLATPTGDFINPTSAVGSIIVDNGGTGYGQGPGFLAPYPGQIVATQNANELTGISNLAARGRSGNATITAAKTYAKNVIDGTYLTNSPVSSIITTMKNKNSAAFLSFQSLTGRNSLLSDINTPLAQSLTTNTANTYNTRITSKILIDDYAQERGIMDSAMGYGIELGKQDLINAEYLRQAGIYARDYLQGTYEISHKWFIESEEIKILGLEVFGNCIRALTGSQQTVSEKSNNSQSTLMGAVGMVTTAIGVYNALASTGLFAGSSTAWAEGWGIFAGTMAVEASAAAGTAAGLSGAAAAITAIAL